TTTLDASPTPSTRATTTPDAPPTPLRAKQCTEGQRTPPPPPIAYVGCATPAPRLTHPRLLPHTPLCAYAVGAGGAGGRACKGATRNEGRCNPSGERPGVAPPAQCPRMRAKVGGRAGGAGRGRAGRNPEKGHTRTEGCAHEGSAPPRARKGGRMCERGTTQPGQGPRAKRKGTGTLSAPSRPINRLRKIHV
ncbi:hypothetical protein BJY52DRAFT_1279997, partial [Lactarius psammicola]